MSLLPMENPASSGLALAMQLGDLLRGSDERNRASAAAQSASADYGELYRALMTGVNQSNPLVQMLLQRMTEAGDPIGELDEEAIRNREMQRFSALAPAVDRAHALAASQGFAQSMRSGMMDSTQAADQAGALTRNFADVYAKLQENARTTAFTEALERLKAMLSNNQGNAQQLQAAMSGINQYAQNAQRIASERMQAATRAQSSASGAWQEALAKAIGSPMGQRLLGMADDKLGEWLGNRQSGQTQIDLPGLRQSNSWTPTDWSNVFGTSNAGSSLGLGGANLSPGGGLGLQPGGGEGLQWPTGGIGQGINPSFNLGTGSSNLMSGWNNTGSSRELLQDYNNTNNSWSSGSSGSGSWSSAPTWDPSGTSVSSFKWNDGEDWWN